MVVWDRLLRQKTYPRHLIPVRGAGGKAPEGQVRQADEWKKPREKCCRSKLRSTNSKRMEEWVQRWKPAGLRRMREKWKHRAVMEFKAGTEQVRSLQIVTDQRTTGDRSGVARPWGFGPFGPIHLKGNKTPGKVFHLLEGLQWHNAAWTSGAADLENRCLFYLEAPGELLLLQQINSTFFMAFLFQGIDVSLLGTPKARSTHRAAKFMSQQSNPRMSHSAHWLLVMHI